MCNLFKTHLSIYGSLSVIVLQVQMEMYTTRSHYCDLITWTPQLCVICRVPRCEDFIRAAVGTIRFLDHSHPTKADVGHQGKHFLN